MIECSLDIPRSPGETHIWILCSRAHWLLICVEPRIRVVKVYDYGNVKHVSKNIVHEVLERHGSVGEPKRHDTPFEGAITGPEGCFPFITFSYAYKMISMSKIKFGVDAGRAAPSQGGQK